MNDIKIKNYYQSVKLRIINNKRVHLSLYTLNRLSNVPYHLLYSFFACDIACIEFTNLHREKVLDILSRFDQGFNPYE